MDECTQSKDIINPNIKLKNKYSVLEIEQADGDESSATSNQKTEKDQIQQKKKTKSKSKKKTTKDGASRELQEVEQNVLNSSVTIVDHDGEENHPRSASNDDFTHSTSDHHHRVNHQNSTSVEDRSKANATRESTHNTVRSQESKQDIVIIGDSIIKHINPTKLSKRKVHKFTYPGKTASDRNNELSLINIHSMPSHVIVHAGTSNIPLQSADQCTNDIEKLIAGVKQILPNSKIGISSITMRQHIESASKINEVNEKIKTITPKHEVKFIDNSSLDKTSLNVSKLHLNAKGSAILATHFIGFIKGGQSPTYSLRSSRQDFQMGTMNQLQELLKLILRMNRLPTR